MNSVCFLLLLVFLRAAALIGNAESGWNLLGTTFVTPHKTASSFLNRVLETVARHAGVCKLNDLNCQGIRPKPECHAAVHGRVHVPQAEWGPDCAGLYAQVLSGHPGIMNFANTPYIWTHRGDGGSVLHPTGDPHHRVRVFFHHRHPFDAECSAYMSYGWHHRKPPNINSHDWNERMERVRNMTANEWVEDHIQGQIDYMNYACEQAQNNPQQYILSSYADMVSNFTDWLSVQTHIASGRKHDADEMAFLVQGIDTSMENDGQHKTHLQPGRYLEELTSDAIEELRARVRSSVPDHCLCELLKYDDFCAVPANTALKVTAHARPAVDPLLKKWGVDDE